MEPHHIRDGAVVSLASMHLSKPSVIWTEYETVLKQSYRLLEFSFPSQLLC